MHAMVSIVNDCMCIQFAGEEKHNRWWCTSK